jgi:hypothetical protein
MLQTPYYSIQTTSKLNKLCIMQMRLTHKEKTNAIVSPTDTAEKRKVLIVVY